LAPLLIGSVFLAALAIYWEGLGPGDAERYLEAALRWQSGPFLGDTHWALRHLFVLPIAASFAAFGLGEAAAILPNIAFAALTVLITWTFGRRHLGARAGLIAAMLLATSAYFVARPLELDVYGAEAFFAALATWLFLSAGDGKARARLLFFAGLVAGMASTVREPSVYLLAVFGLLIVLEGKEVMRSLALVGVGFGVVIGVEAVFYAVAAGDPFYRYKIDLGHRDIGVNEAMTPARAALPARAARALSFLATTPATTPMLGFALASLVYLRAARWQLSGGPWRSLRAFGAAAILSAILAPLVFNLSAPRYYPLLNYACVLVIAVALAKLFDKGRARAAIAAGLAVAAVNFAAADFVRGSGYAEARLLARLAAASAEPIHADPLTAHRARYQLRLSGMTPEAAAAKAVNARFAPPGALFFRAPPLQGSIGRWCVIEKFDAPPDRWTHRLIRNGGLAGVFGRRMAEIAAPPHPAYLARQIVVAAPRDPVSGKACLSR